MNDALIDAFRHNAWATRELLQVCAQLSDVQLQASVEGTFGTIIWTLWHTVASEAGYLTRLSGAEPAWDRHAETPPSVNLLIEFNDDLEGRWMTFLSRPFDATRSFPIEWYDGVVRDVPATIPLIQAIHHGSEHRSQVATILTQIGIEPPEWGAWEYAEHTGRAPVLRT